MPKLKKKSDAQKARERLQRNKKLRDDKAIRDEEQEVNSQARKSSRQDEQKRKKEQEADTQARKSAREDKQRRSDEQLSDTEARQIARKDPIRRKREQELDTESRKRKRTLSKSRYEDLLEMFYIQIRESPSYICSCCGRLWYETSTKITSEEHLQSIGCSDENIATYLYVAQTQHRLCGTCRKSTLTNSIPRLALANGLDFPIIPDELKVYKYFNL
jgi:hypothetical protein